MKFRKFGQGKFCVGAAAFLAACASLLGVQSTSAQDSGQTITGNNICMQQVYGGPLVTNSNQLNCTANDIRISRATFAYNQATGDASCIRGEKFTLVATFEVNVTANARYDAGFFFNIGGGANARDANGTCSLSQLYSSVPPALNLDGDTCGDLNSGIHNVTFTIPEVLCQDSNNNRKLNLPNCTSWHSNQGTACTLDSDASDAKPDTKSKCVCDDTFEVPVNVELPGITVTKTASTGQTDSEGNPTLNEPGGPVTYTVTVKNDGNFVALTINSLTDDLYGDITKSGAANTNITSTTCSVPMTIQPQSTYKCQFIAPVTGANGGAVIIDTVCASGKDANQEDIGPTCDDAKVTIVGVAPSATVEKKAIDAVVRFQVKVTNTSANEEITLTRLCDDKYGAIATSGSLTCTPGTLGSIVETTCGPLPVTLKVNGEAGDTYTCDFDVVVGINAGAQTNTVQATASDNDVPPTTIYPQGSATVTITATP